MTTLEPRTDYEPVAIESDFPEPTAAIDPDQSLGWMRRLWPLVLQRRLAFAVIAITGITGVAVNATVPLTVRGAIDQALTEQTADLEPFVWRLVITAIALFVLRLVYRYTLFFAAYAIETDLRDVVYQHLTRLSFSFYDRTPSGEVISRANSDIRSIQLLLAFGPLAILSSLSFFIAIVLMLRIDVGLTLVAIVTMPGVYIVAQRLRQRVFPLMWISQSRMAEVAMVVDENINGTRVVKAFAAESGEVTKLARAAQRLRWSAIEAVDARARHNPVIEALPQLGAAGLLLYGGWRVIDDALTIGDIVAFNAYIILITVPFRLFGFLLMQAQRAGASAGRIYEILDAEPEIVDPPDPIDLHDPKGAIEFDDVSFAYPASLGGDDGRPNVLDGFSMRIEPGETVAIVGRTGSGKSTIIRLLPRFYDTDAGAVRIDGIDVRALQLTSLRHAVNVVFDEPFLFSASVRDNIAFAVPNAPEAEVIAAAKAAHADGFIRELAEGYDTVVGERGYTLSGGQRQRIAIARTLLANPAVLVLDDATSAIDVHVEEQIYEALRELLQDRTTVIIAHRLSTIALADRVVLLEDGRVAASGTHQELLATEPRYAEVLANVETPPEPPDPVTNTSDPDNPDKRRPNQTNVVEDPSKTTAPDNPTNDADKGMKTDPSKTTAPDTSTNKPENNLVEDPAKTNAPDTSANDPDKGI